MSKKNDKQKPISKGMAAVLSATMAATSVISVLPVHVASASQETALLVANSATNASEMQTALFQEDLALNLSGYDLLSPTGKSIVASNLINRKPSGGFTSSLEIQTMLNEEVNARQNVEILINAINAVNVATTASDMKIALENVSLGLILTTYNNLSTPDGKLAAAQLLVNYRLSNGNFTSQQSIQDQFNIAVQDTVDAEAIALAVNNVNNASSATTLLTALEAPYLGLILDPFHKLSSTARDWVVLQIYNFIVSNPFNNKDEIQNKLNTYVTQRSQYEAYAAAVKVVNDATTAAATRSALEASNLGLDLQQYYLLTSAHKNAAAQAVLNFKNTITTPSVGLFEDQPSIQTALDTAVAIERVSQAVDVVNNATDINSMMSALTSPVLGLTLTDYNSLLSADKDAVAALVLANRGGGYSNKAVVDTALTAAITTNAPIAAVNKAGDASTMQTALESGLLGLLQGALYPSWTPADKAAVAEDARLARPGTGYVDITAVQAAFNTAVTARTLVANVNIAANTGAMQTAMEALFTTIEQGVYTGWATADKLDVASAVKTAIPTGGYLNKVAVQTAFNTAVTARTQVANVNTAMNVAATQAAIEALFNTTEQGIYASWTAADKLDVATAVRAAIPIGGYANKADVQAKFDVAVAARTLVANVNIATLSGMQTALEAVVSLGATYPNWSNADKAAVAAAVLQGRPAGDGYANISTIQTAFNNAVGIVAPMADINGATTTAAMKNALIALSLPEYDSDLPTAQQDDIADLLRNSRPIGGYSGISAVKAVLKVAVAFEYVNIASDTEEMRAALENVELGLNLDVYNDWSEADKNAVADAVLDNSPVGGYTTLTDAVDAVQVLFNAALTERTLVANVNVAIDAAATQTALETLLSLSLGVEYPVWTAADKTAVAISVRAGVGAGYADKDEIQTAFNAAVTARTLVANVNVATNVAATQTALEALFDNTEQGVYVGWTTADKLNVSTAVKAAIPTGGYTNKAAVKTAFDTAVTTRSLVANVNTAGSAAAAQTALEALLNTTEQGVYAGWTAADKLNVATAVKAAIPVGGYTNKAAVQTAFDIAITARTLVANVNTAADEAATQTALEALLNTLEQGVYADWTDADKLDVATAVKAAIPTGGYASKTAVQTAFAAAVTARTSVANVNIAGNTTAIQAALVDALLNLNLTSYNSLSISDKWIVASYLLQNRPGDGFANKAAIQLALESAIDTDASLAAVNNALNATAMQTALENVALGLDLGVYANWTAADKQNVAAAVRTAIPVEGYEDEEAVQAAFDLAVIARTPVANVNIAASAAASQTAIETLFTNLELGVYTSWTDADKLDVAAAVKTTIPTGGYLDKAAVQSAFIAALSTRTAVANVNIAEDEAETQSALEALFNTAEQGVYANWTDADKRDVATGVYAAIPTGGYINKAAVKADFDIAVAARTLVANVNIAEDEEETQSALEALFTTSEQGVYANWTDADKLDVATGVYAAIPTGGYINKAAVKADFDIAVEARTLVANVNIAADKTAMKTALEALLTAGEQGAYASWTDTDKLDVAAAVKAVIPSEGLTDKGEVQDAFDTAVTARTLVANVNIASNASAMKAALEVVNLGLDLSVYNTLGNADKLNTSTKVLAIRDLLGAGNGFIDLIAIQTALDNSLEAGALNRDAAALEIEFVPNNGASHVTDQLTLPLSGVEGSTISWSSDSENIVSNDGDVIRPDYLTGDVAVTLTATLTKNGVSKTKEFVIKVIKLAITDSESVLVDKAALEIIYGTGDKAVSVTNDLTLPTTGSNGTTITWSSNITSAIDNDGTVTRPAMTDEDVIVKLTATITKNNKVDTKVFDVMVIKETNDAVESIAADKAALDIGYTGNDAAGSVTQSLSLQVNGTNGTTITWSSSNTSVITANGTVNRPANTADDIIVTLTATITKNGKVDTKVFNVTVVKQTTLNDAESVAADKAALSITYSGVDMANSITQSFSLLDQGMNGTTITWSSSNTAVIAEDGTVTRPANTAADVNVKLTATITKNGKVDTKVFNVTVIKETSFNDTESVATDKAALSIMYNGVDTANSVTQSLSLLGNGLNGTTITWSSSNTTVIAGNGTVTRPANTAADVNVTLTATITKNGKVDTKVFNVTVVKETSFNDEESVAADKSALSITYSGVDTANSITQSLSLLGNGLNGTTITWSSNNTSVIAVNGTVTRPANTAANASVTLTATITKNGKVDTKVFNVTVVKETTFNDAESVEADKAALVIGYTGVETAGSVTQNLSLQSNGTNGTTIKWSSSNTSVIAVNGTVTRPTNTAENVIVTLTATITKNGKVDTKSFDVTVVKETTLNDAESVGADKAALVIGYTGVETAVGVTQNLSLQINGTNGTTIKWFSSNTSVIAENGTVTRPANTAADVNVKLTATITKNGKVDTKVFDVKVLKDNQTSAPLSSDIVVTNNVAGQNDLVRVNNLLAGDVVKVYKTTGELLGTATVGNGATFATVQIAQLGATAGSVQITVTRVSMEESIKVNAVYAAENAKPYIISDTVLDTTSGIVATVKVTPTEGLVYSGPKYVIFELMDGDTAVSIIALDYDGKTALNLTANFNTVYNANHKVKVMILDQFTTDMNNVGTPLANQVVLKK